MSPARSQSSRWARRGTTLGGYVTEARQAVRDQVKLPAGYHVEWSGQFEYLQRAQARLQMVVPLKSAGFAEPS